MTLIDEMFAHDGELRRCVAARGSSADLAEPLRVVERASGRWLLGLQLTRTASIQVNEDVRLLLMSNILV